MNKEQHQHTVLLTLLLMIVSQSSGQANGDIRLVGGSPNSPKLAGIVEVYLNDEWMRLLYSQTVSDCSCKVVCRQLGYSDCLASGSATNFGFVYSSNISSLLYLNCYSCKGGFSYEPHILHCSHSEEPRSLSPSYDFSVQCSVHRVDANPYDTQVRLVGGETGFTSSGFVEMYKNNRWGPVCNMNAADADSACRQLGYTNSSSYGSSEKVSFSEEDQADIFTCGNSSENSHRCLSSCLQELHSNSTCQSHTYVNCTFLEEYSTISYGSATCGYKIPPLPPFPDPPFVPPIEPPSIEPPSIEPPHDDNSQATVTTMIIVGVIGCIFLFIVGIIIAYFMYVYFNKRQTERRQYEVLE